MKGRALRRALETKDAFRISGDIPLIVDTTELITPDVAYAMLEKNENNRPINWNKVEEYSKLMKEGKWELHAQGIVLDTNGNILTGQKRLWAIIYSNTSVYMRVSRGNPPQVARLLDRGDPQTARDLAARGTGRKHSPVEASVARGILASQGILRPSVDKMAEAIEDNAIQCKEILELVKGTKKTKGIIMILSGIIVSKVKHLNEIAQNIDKLEKELENVLLPETPESCWNKGAAFSLAMKHSLKIVESYKKYI